MFGNMALKYWYEENCAEFGKNMFHFVCDDDVVPASLYANYAFNQLSFAFKIAIKVISESGFDFVLSSKEVLLFLNQNIQHFEIEGCEADQKLSPLLLNQLV